MSEIVLIESSPGSLETIEKPLHHAGFRVRAFPSEWMASTRAEMFVQTAGLVVDSQCRGVHIERIMRHVGATVSNRIVVMGENADRATGFDPEYVDRARECLDALSKLPGRNAIGMAWIDAVIMPAPLVQALLEHWRHWPPGPGEAVRLVRWASTERVIISDFAKALCYELYPSGRVVRQALKTGMNQADLISAIAAQLSSAGVEPAKKNPFLG